MISDIQKYNIQFFSKHTTFIFDILKIFYFQYTSKCNIIPILKVFKELIII